MPYAPAVQDRGAEYLFQGISSAGNSIGRALDYYAERREKQKEEDKQRARKFKSMVDYMDASGMMTRDVAMTKDVDALEGYMQGTIAKQKIEQAAIQLANAKQQQADRAALASFAQDYTSGDPAALGRMVSPLDTAPVGQGFSGFNPENMKAFSESTAPANRLTFALGRNPGAFAAPQFDNSFAALQRYSGANPDGTPVYTEDPKTHFRHVLYGKSILPSGVVSDAQGSGLREMVSPGGQLLGFIHTDMRGKETFIKPPPSVNLKQARDEGGNALPGIFMDSGGKSHDFRDYYQKFGIDKPAPNEAEQAGFWSRLFGKDKVEKKSEEGAKKRRYNPETGKIE